MEQKGKKKEWVAPELLVLVRSHPEEAVLAACKGGSIPGDSGSAYEVCIGLGDFCALCTTPAAS
jgi:hypothetical protein